MIGLACGAFLLLALTPISADGTWWDLSRGRVVLDGHVAPSRQLLAADQQLEADWLGGVPFYLLYQLAESTGLMAARVGLLAAVAAAIFETARRGRIGSPRRAGLPHPWTLGLALLAVACAAPAADPAGGYWDLVGVLLVARAARAGGWGWGAAAAGLLWANLGPRVALVPCVWWTSGMVARAGRRRWTDSPASGSRYPALLRGFVIVLIAGCGTPRGIATWWDSLRLLLPPLADTQLWWADSPWVPLTSSRWGGVEYATLAAGVLALLYPTRTLRERIGLALAVVIGGACVWLYAANAAVVGVWLCLLLASVRPAPVLGRRLRALRRRARPPRFASAPRGALGFTSGLALVLLSCWLSGISVRAGWGLAARLDPRLVRLVMEQSRPEGVAWSADLRAVGMFSWVADGRLPAHDVPHRALLGGRWRELVQLRDDLRQGRSTRYYHPDGSPGGWWLALQDRQVSLLLVPAEEHSMISALAPGIWQPLSLDAPVLLYARAGDPNCLDLHVRVVSQRDYVEYGPWQFTPAPSTGSDYDRDRFWLPTPRDWPALALRQAEVFRALHLRMAALRVLQTVLQSAPSRQAAAQFIAVQSELRQEEFVATGAVTPFRYAAQRSAAGPWNLPLPKMHAAPPAEPTPEVLAGASHYGAGRREAALAELAKHQDPAARLAAALLRWEAGDVGQAERQLAELYQSAAPRDIQNIARFWSEQLRGVREPAAAAPGSH